MKSLQGNVRWSYNYRLLKSLQLMQKILIKIEKALRQKHSGTSRRITI